MMHTEARMELRALTYLDVPQPQVAGFIQTGMMPLDGQAALAALSGRANGGSK